VKDARQHVDEARASVAARIKDATDYPREPDGGGGSGTTDVDDVVWDDVDWEDPF